MDRGTDAANFQIMFLNSLGRLLNKVKSCRTAEFGISSEGSWERSFMTRAELQAALGEVIVKLSFPLD
jgi:hypothetical protein